MNKNRIIILIIIFILILFLIGSIFVYLNFFKEEKSPSGVDTGKVISIPEEIKNNKYGFLVGGPDEAKEVVERGGAWARPHPGPFLWDSMQKSEESEISFVSADKTVKNYQKHNVGLPVTIWPYAQWDQKNRSDVENCKVANTDEFLMQGPFFPKDIGYLPEHRCNPNDWEAYRKWIVAIVERYDGDGKADMPGLKVPIKYWEIINEPDLSPPENFAHGFSADDPSLDFYKQEEEGYAELLKNTYQYIKEADKDAQVMIAGAAGGNDEFLGFYRNLFKIEGVIDSFDIANVHCISNDDYESFNLAPYLELLAEFDIEKTTWVTESEAIISDDPDINATQTYYSTKKALELGAEKVFYTRKEFKDDGGGKEPPKPIDGKMPNIEPEIDGSDGVEAYRVITSL